MIEADFAGQFGPDLKALNFGMKVRYSRTQIKMSTERAGILYAKAIGRKKPYTPRRMEQMELNDDFPADQARRWAIARIVQMSLFFTLDPELELAFPREVPKTKHLKSVKLDLNEYEARLQDYWEFGVKETVEETMEDITERICNLHDNVLYDKQKGRMRRLLCGYNIVGAQVVEERNEYDLSLTYLNRAIILARENKFTDLQATALHRRESTFLDRGDFTAALLDYDAAQQIKNIPPQLQGKILSVAGSAKAHLAQKQAEVEEAFVLLDEAEKLIGADTLADFGYLVSFDEERYLLDRGATYMASPVKNLRSPEDALDYLPHISGELDLSHTQAYRQAYNQIIQATAYMDQGLYPMAASLADNALSLLESIRSKVHMEQLATLCNTLKKSQYGNTTEVAMLEIGIMRNLRPELFN